MKQRFWFIIFTLVLYTLPAFAQEVKRPRITGISHIAVFVHNLEASRAFYKDFLGYEEPYRLYNSDSTISLAVIKVNDTQCIELFPTQTEVTDRLNQIALITDNAEALRVYLASRGLDVPEKVSKGTMGNYYFLVKDPDGYTIEIVQYAPDSWTMRDTGKYMTDARISTHLKHIGFAVDSLQRAMKFYCDILGFKETWRGSRDGKELSFVSFNVPDGTDYLEFILYKEKPTMEQLGVMNHISLEVSNIQKSVNTLEARSVRKAYTGKLEVRTGINRKRQCNLFDPDGTRTEIMEASTVDGAPTPSSTAPPPK